jgi:hypothetical protein
MSKPYPIIPPPPSSLKAYEFVQLVCPEIEMALGGESFFEILRFWSADRLEDATLISRSWLHRVPTNILCFACAMKRSAAVLTTCHGGQVCATRGETLQFSSSSMVLAIKETASPKVSSSKENLAPAVANSVGMFAVPPRESALR